MESREPGCISQVSAPPSVQDERLTFRMLIEEIALKRGISPSEAREWLKEEIDHRKRLALSGRLPGSEGTSDKKFISYEHNPQHRHDHRSPEDYM